jgi:hypothetical protein
MKRTNIIVALLVVFLSITLPFGLAALIGGREHVFIGLLLNPVDGASYLAKMYQGWEGAWRFTLPYTAEPGNGAYLFLFYLFLGHLARWLGLPFILTFHLARLAGAGLLMLALLSFYERVFAGRPELYRIACWLTLFGSGMGWLILFLGQTPTDFWVAEAYPFLAMYTNPHFSTGLALLLFAFILVIDPAIRFREMWLVLLGLLLAIVLPFGVVVVLFISAGWLVWTWLETRRLEWRPVVCLGLLGGPFLLYQFWAVQVDPILALWNQQNQTPSPPIWDFLLAFSPALVLALFGLVHLLKLKDQPARRILITWLILGLVLVYFPFSLQRRFMLGFYIPVAALAVFGLDDLRQRLSRGIHAGRARLLAPALFTLALPTNLLVILIGLAGAVSHAPILYLTRDEARALAWIQDQTPPRALVLTSPEMGSLVPAFTGRRVIYGHPYETVSATQEKQCVQGFYSQLAQVSASTNLLNERRVDYILYGPRERGLGGHLDFSALELVFESGDVQVYAVQEAR